MRTKGGYLAAVFGAFASFIAVVFPASASAQTAACGFLACEQWVVDNGNGGQPDGEGNYWKCGNPDQCYDSYGAQQIWAFNKKANGVPSKCSVPFNSCNCSGNGDIDTEFYNADSSGKKCVAGCSYKFKQGGHTCSPMNLAQPGGYQFCTGPGMQPDGDVQCNPVNQNEPPPEDPPPQECNGDQCVEHKVQPPQICMSVQGKDDVCIAMPDEVGSCKGSPEQGYICSGNPPPLPPPPPDTAASQNDPNATAAPNNHYNSNYTNVSAGGNYQNTNIFITTYQGGNQGGGSSGSGSGGSGGGGTGSGGSAGAGGAGGAGGQGGSGGAGGAGGDGGDGGAGGEGGEGGDAKDMCQPGEGSMPAICDGVELCKGDGNDPAFCKGICDAGANGGNAPAFCSNQCDGDSPPAYCTAICEQDGSDNGLMCKGMCEGNDSLPFCKTLCEQDGAPSFCENDATGGETCAAPPSCTGDGIACAILRETWTVRCTLSPDAPDEDFAGPGGPGADEVFGEDEEVNFANLDASGFIGLSGGQCPALPTVSFMGASYNMADWVPCNALAILAMFILLGGYVQAAFIIGKG